MNENDQKRLVDERFGTYWTVFMPLFLVAAIFLIMGSFKVRNNATLRNVEYSLVSIEDAGLLSTTGNCHVLYSVP